MNEKKYCRLVTVDTGDGLRTAHLELGITVSPGDMVSLDTDECGIAIAAILVEEGGEEYAFIANLTPFYKATSVYRCVWNREDPNEPA